MPVALTLWSLGLGQAWSLAVTYRIALLAMGMLVGARFYVLRFPEADKTSYRLYNVRQCHSSSRLLANEAYSGLASHFTYCTYVRTGREHVAGVAFFVSR